MNPWSQRASASAGMDELSVRQEERAEHRCVWLLACFTEAMERRASAVISL